MLDRFVRVFSPLKRVSRYHTGKKKTLALYDIRIKLPYLQVRKHTLIAYSLPADSYSHLRSKFDTPTYSGTVTTGAAKRIRKAVDLLLQLSPMVWIENPITHNRETHTLSFITLTIPEQKFKPEAAYGNKNLLAPFLLQMRRKYKMEVYLWKAEFQTNGMLHYHITTRSWIHHSYIKETWNNILRQHNLLHEHYAKHDGKEPPTTQVKKVYKNKKLEFYLQKEISKAQQNTKTKGKIWDCSQVLKEARFYTTLEPSNFTIPTKDTKFKDTGHCQIISHKNPISLLPKQIQVQYNQHLKDIGKFIVKPVWNEPKKEEVKNVSTE